MGLHFSMEVGGIHFLMEGFIFRWRGALSRGSFPTFGGGRSGFHGHAGKADYLVENIGHVFIKIQCLQEL